MKGKMLGADYTMGLVSIKDLLQRKMAQLHINQENLFQGPSVSVSGNVTSWEGTGEHLNSEELIHRDCAGRSFL